LTDRATTTDDAVNPALYAVTQAWLMHISTNSVLLLPLIVYVFL